MTQEWRQLGVVGMYAPKKAKKAYVHQFSADVRKELEMRHLPVEHRDEPIRGRKGAFLALDAPASSRVRFYGQSGYGPYDAEDEARCGAGHDHPSPSLDCACGFYLAVDWPAHVTGQSWLLDVELYGTIYACGNQPGQILGYRADYQRVLKVTVPLTCHCGAPGLYLTTSATGYGTATLLVACGPHAAGRAIREPLAWLRGKLGTEVEAEFLRDGLPLPEMAPYVPTVNPELPPYVPTYTYTYTPPPPGTAFPVISGGGWSCGGWTGDVSSGSTATWTSAAPVTWTNVTGT